MDVVVSVWVVSPLNAFGELLSTSANSVQRIIIVILS